VSDTIRSDVGKIASSLTGAKNDADNAGRIARLASSENKSVLLGNRSIQDFHLDMVGDLAIEAGGARTTAEASDAVFSALFAQRESVSGVSLDEEAINLTQFETAYQGAARYLSVVDELTTEILRLI
jgi:flagellar hook-associated protein 1 FlgK